MLLFFYHVFETNIDVADGAWTAEEHEILFVPIYLFVCFFLTYSVLRHSPNAPTFAPTFFPTHLCQMHGTLPPSSSKALR